MNLASAKILASLIASVMTFLGWDTPDYAPLLPKQIQSEIELIATSTLVILPPLETKAEPKPKPPVVRSKPTETPIPKPVVTPKPTPVAQPPKAPAPVSVPPTPTNIVPEKPSPTFTTEAEKIRAAVVNIYCTMQSGGQIAHYSGSGVVIDPAGVILTNAHVAEHVLLEEAGRETCFIRTGSPASNSYKAKVVYLPDAWIENNKFNLKSQILTGTGENDYAILTLSSRVSQSAYDVPLPYLAPDMSSVSQGASITIAGYPILSQSVTILSTGLYALTDPSTIQRTYGYSGAGSDVVNTGASTLAQHGTSGGAIVGSNSKLIAIIDSQVVDPQTGGNAVQGITLSYINSSLGSHGKSLQSLVDNAVTEAENFKASKVQYLSGML